MLHVPTPPPRSIRPEDCWAAHQRATSVRLVGRRGAIAITRGAGEVVVTLEGERVEELLPRAAAELSVDLGRLEHLVVDASRVHDEGLLLCARWAEAHRDRARRVTFLGPETDVPPASVELAIAVESAMRPAGGLQARLA